jgi:hypothetical protein
MVTGSGQSSGNYKIMSLRKMAQCNILRGINISAVPAAFYLRMKATGSSEMPIITKHIVTIEIITILKTSGKILQIP